MRRINIKDKIIILIIIILVLTVLNLKFLNKKIMPKLLDYAKIESQKLGTLIINDAVSKKIVEELDIDNLYIITKNNENEIISIDLNPKVVNKVLTTVTHQLELNLKCLENDKIDMLDLPKNIILTDTNKKGIYLSIPTGIVFSNSLLANLGPKIPIKLEFVGSILSGINTKITNYGINNALLEISLDLKVNLKVILPFVSDEIEINTNVPLTIKMLNGKVPTYYLNGYLSNPINLSK